MFKKIKKLGLIIPLILLTACSPGNISDGLSVMVGKKQVAEDAFVSPDQDTGLKTLVYDEDFDAGGYYYKHLSDIDKTVYQAIYNCVSESISDTTMRDITDSQIIRAYKSVIFDHPEIFYVDGYQIEKYTGADNKTVFRPNYTKPPDEIPNIQAQIDAYEASIKSGADLSTSFTTVRSIYDYIITHTTYNIMATDLSNLCSVINGQAVCDGYAKATMYFCNKFGIECIVVPGYIRSSGTAHLWNAVKIDDLWYFIDVTWGDEDFQNDQATPEVRYDYLCVSQEQINGTHQLEDFISPPACVSSEANYYYQTGRVITVMDKQQLDATFANIETNTAVSFACADQKIYQQVEDYLIMQKHIFDYMPSKKVNVGYVTNPNVMSYTFWIRGQG